jgi:uncharacterized secreted protein with C-terminal beta-propeller domain
MRPVEATTSVLTVVDLNRPTAPRVLAVEELEGSILAAREHTGAVRVVLQTGPPPDEPRAGLDWLPTRTTRDAAGAAVRRGPLLECARVHHPPYAAGVGTLSVLTVRVTGAAPEVSDAVAVAADGQHVYASTDRLYVATTRGGWWSWPEGFPGGRVSTDLHAFDIIDPDRTRYTASGRVDGWLLGRWGMSEYDGLLRVATTRGPEGPAKQTDSAVTVLRERGGRLDVVGAVGGLGQAERIRAVRWFGDLAVVVTFRQIDPLYTVDLSDPEKPALVGQLKVPGYSGYLHPVGGGLLLAVGQGATSDGRVLGARLSSFDLSDLAAPKRQDVLDLRGSWSPVEDDARAFTYLPEPRLAVVPVEDALRAARIEPDGSLTLTGRWRLPGSVPERAVPVAGGRLAVLAGGPERTLTLVDAATLRPLAPPLGLDHRSGSGHTVPPWPSPCSVPRTQCPR